jgi:hypothetical protein
MSNGLVVGRLYDGDKVVEVEHRILGDHFAAEVSNLLVYSSKRSRSLCNVRRPSGVSVLNKIYVGIVPSFRVVQGDRSVSGFALGVRSNLSASGKPTSSRTVYEPLRVGVSGVQIPLSPPHSLNLLPWRRPPCERQLQAIPTTLAEELRIRV